MIERLVELDTQLFLWLNSFHSPGMDKVMWFISGKEEWYPMYLIIAGYIVYKYRWRSIPIILGLILTVALADQIAAKIFKEGFERLRPTHNTQIGELVHIVNDYRGGSYGFVSNHAANSFSLAVFLSLIFRNRWFIALILFWAAVVSYSRIYLGVHYPADIIGGALLGSILAWGVNFIRLKIEPFTNKWLPEKEKAKKG